MKISYIVNVDLNDKQARAVQVYSNALMFHKYLKDDFSCVCIGKDNNIFKNIWVNNIKIESSKTRKLLFHIQSIKYILETDVVYSRNLSILWLASLFGKKIVWEMHDGISGANLKFFNKLFKKLKIVAISDGLNKYLINEYNFNKDNILIAHDGVFLENYDELRKTDKSILRKDLNLLENRTIVMHTGSLYKGRGAELFEVIIKNFPELYFVQVGGNTENIIAWKEYYREYNNILFIGHQNNDNLIKYQMSADLLFLPMTKNSPIWWCTSPMKVFEYMATSIPILGSNVGSVGEVISKRNSIIFNPEDEQTIIGGVKYFLANKEEAEKLANHALEDIENKYRWDLRVENIIRFIKK
jgi:glycosyltransferase involved in cell wall biosynthesis